MILRSESNPLDHCTIYSFLSIVLSILTVMSISLLLVYPTSSKVLGPDFVLANIGTGKRRISELILPMVWRNRSLVLNLFLEK